MIRTAEANDAAGMSRVLNEIIHASGREGPSAEPFVLSNYIRNPTGVLCSVALDAAGDILGFQSLIKAAACNPYGVPEGWGIVGTHISPRAHRRGVGTALFVASRAAATRAGLMHVVASISRSNESALRYYAALGFQSFREDRGTVHQVLECATDNHLPGGGG